MSATALGHSTGGMTAARFTLMYPDWVSHLALEDPLGLADYRIGIPPQSEETLYQHEVNWTDPAALTFQMIYQQPAHTSRCPNSSSPSSYRFSPAEGRAVPSEGAPWKWTADVLGRWSCGVGALGW
jgi:pimeloyl-ACP methyl ester carboxylesterase